MDRSYTLQPDGLPGNDDYGTMSAWFCWSALGLYPVSGTTRYAVASPIFKQITLHRAVGDLRIIANNASESNVYVAKLTVNGRQVDMINSPFVDHSEIAAEAELVFYMTSAPLLH
jgi:putative alpha-1,2-mannosidase